MGNQTKKYMLFVASPHFPLLFALFNSIVHFGR